jgi:hypothetical protein
MKKLAFYGLSLLASGSAFAAFPSHCTSSEYSIVSAWMGAKDKAHNSKTDKIVSLCADKKAEPFSVVTYRYGVLGNVEMEVVATPQNKFKIANESTTPHSGVAVVFFQKGDYTYYISVAGGMASGVSLDVFKGQKRIASGFSGTDEGKDFQVGPAEIDFVRAMYFGRAGSPVLVLGKIKHDIFEER